jgi:hypothetical protein
VRGKWIIAAALAAVLAAGAGAVFASDAPAFLRIGTAYAAKQTCSCLFVSGRELASCKGEYDQTSARLLSWRADERSVTVSALGLVSAEAVFEEGFGCRLAR